MKPHKVPESVDATWDVASRKQAEAVLREQEDKFRIAFENAPIGMSIIGPKGEYLAANPALCRMVGYSREEILAGTINKITHPDDIERGNLWIRKMMAGDHSEPEFEKRYVHKDGHVVWGLVRAQWVRNDDGSPRMSVVHVLDITERKQSEQEIHARERRLREAHEIAQMGDWQLDLKRGSMRWAEGIYRLLEFDVATTTPSFDLFTARVHPDDRGDVAGVHAAAIDQNTQADIIHRLLLPDGRVKFVRRIFRVEPNLDGLGSWVSGILQDITSIRHAEEQRAQLESKLHRAQKMEAIGYLAGGVAHDFNNLLTVMGGNASLALIDAPAGSAMAELLSEILKGVSSAAELTRQLLAFSRKQVIAPKVMNLNGLIGQMSAMLRRLLGEDLEFKTILAPDLGQVRLDAGQLEQILVNLAVNARDAMVDGGKLTVETANVVFDGETSQAGSQRPSGSFIMLAVSDNGSGMSEDIKQHIFEPFFTTKDAGRGTGLGLAMVYGAVSQNHGHIEVYSEVGVGTTFKIYLPRVNQDADAPQALPSAVTPAGHETIVFVEDDLAVKHLGERVLVRNGYKVFAFAHGAEALAAVRAMEAPFDLLVTDVVMPGMNGRALSEEVRKVYPKVKVLFTSGYTQNVIAHHGVLEAGIEFLAKPYSPEVLARRVREVLG